MADNRTAPDPSTVRHDGPWRHLDVRGNGIRLHAVQAGPDDADAPLVVLVHGFGQYWWSWRHQLTALGDAGYRAVAVDLRGYGDSDKPPRGYDGWTLAGDLSGLIRGLGHDEAFLVGHGDGGQVCWAASVLYPAHVRGIVTVSAPHPLGLRRAALADASQRSVLAPRLLSDQIPRLGEHRLTTNDGAGAAALLRERAGAEWARTADFAEAERRVRTAIRIDGTAHCALEYHRWAFRSQFRPDGARFRTAMRTPPRAPVVQIHGTDDPFMLPDTFRHCTRWAPQRQLESLRAGHFPHQEAPDATTSSILRFLRA
ncbi:alpha/beta fold hydrolase [Tomitella fengzijianii]|uniref:Alpha/beta hydrolase n=1 Tax=Tomitella fengzijianii TaxID=2597660 RepID=A0A516X7C1_9ACTN|nr:alpha/beta hydrolase [Tomitella fengzijianii]QDQ98965.1 alpha/beta hydrolase [Tomitella fengzijianii]